MTNLLAEDLDHILDHTRELWNHIRGERVFITGGTGFVGAWLLESLLWANQRLNASIRTVLLTRRPERFVERLPHLACNPAVTLHQGDAANFVFPDDQFPLVIHAASERIVKPDQYNPMGAFDSNVEGTRRVLKFASVHCTRRMLFTSSGAVYGKQPPGLAAMSEDHQGAPSPSDPQSAYAQSKRISEFLCACHAHVFGLDVCIARMFAFVGPYLPLDEGYAVGNFLRDSLRGGPIRIAGDGTAFRSYLYAADMAIWLWTILIRGKPSYPYNAGSPDAISILQLAERVRSIAAPQAQIELAQKASADTPASRYVPSVTRAELELGLRSWISLDEGIRRTAKWQLSFR